MKSNKIIGRLAGVLMLLVLQTACSPPAIWLSQQGQVLEWPSKKPLEDVLVAANWTARSGLVGHGSTSCYHAEAVYSDTDGRYTIPFWWHGFKTNIDQSVWISALYKAGYKTSTYAKKADGSRGNRYIREDRERGLLYLEVDKRPSIKELELIKNVIKSFQCGPRPERRKHFAAYKKLYGEAKRLAVTEEDKKILRRIRYWISFNWDTSDNTMSIGEAEAFFKKYLKGKFE